MSANGHADRGASDDWTGPSSSTPAAARDGAPRVVITGLGVVLATGAGRDSLASALAASAPRLTTVNTAPGFHAPGTARQAALAQHVDLSPWLPSSRARRLSWPSRFAVAAAEMALADAAIDHRSLAEAPVAVALATAFGTARYAESLVRDIVLQGPEAASPALFSESVANAPAAQVALAADARGTNAAVTQRESGPLQAVLLAAREVRLGRSRVALAGCSEEINSLVHALLGRFRAVAPPSDGGGELARPLDRRRAGMLAAEGAVVLVLEREDEARARGARVLARIAAGVRGFDPSASSYGFGAGGEALGARLAGELARQGVDLGSIDRIVSGASGSVAGDQLEAAVLRRVFDGSVPPLLAPKGVTGEYAGGHLAAGVLAAAGGAAWRTAGFSEPDPDLGVKPHDGSALPPAKRVLLSALAAGGAAAWIVLDAA
ncbi:MAG TPA: beta-ketoacyl synthase N-terminal-like domain-containing protein [Thermoanaerobaculia bacterium]|nr:beta-ketoacyl synthase N-terminal-like domain-containing protein [Thermoanaerobaculia bacterium]